ncbi:MAG: hypothetical protein FD129_618 [bacterium]|nr:MAG: hypothetical protein FD129_618 [bacterium]
MSAKILSWQLCERDMDCDHCPLDAALRRHFARPSTDAPTVGTAMPPGPHHVGDRLPPDRLYGRNHTWVQPAGRTPEGYQVARVGLEPWLARTMLTPRTVVLPVPGERLRKGHPHVWVVTAGGTFPVSAPADGLVIRVNGLLAGQPHVLVDAALDDGWILDMHVRDNDVREAGLLSDDQARQEWAGDEDRLQSLLTTALRGNHLAVGPTLADGGVPLPNAAEMLGPGRYFALLRRLLP